MEEKHRLFSHRLFPGRERNGEKRINQTRGETKTIKGGRDMSSSTNSNSSSSMSSATNQPGPETGSSNNNNKGPGKRDSKTNQSSHRHHHHHHHHGRHGKSNSAETSGLKMKIKRKSVGGSRSSEVKHEVVLETPSSTYSTPHTIKTDKKNGVSQVNNNHVHKKKSDKPTSVIRASSPTKATITNDDSTPLINHHHHHLPNEGDASISARKDMGRFASIGTITESDCLGPCEPGTSVTLEGVVWQETEGGILVVNITWRDKSYVGTLLDCTKHDWAPPRCDSPSEDGVEVRVGKGRPKRGKGSTNDSIILKGRPMKGKKATNNFTIPSSPGKAVDLKRKGRDELPSPVYKKGCLIECPEPNCNKKYKHINGLKYHQTHAHGENAKNKEEQEPETEAERETPLTIGDDEKLDDEPSVADGETGEVEEAEMEVDGDNQSKVEEEEEKQVQPVKEPAAPSPAYSDISDVEEEEDDKGNRSNGLPPSGPYPFPFSYPVTAYASSLNGSSVDMEDKQSENLKILRESMELNESLKDPSLMDNDLMSKPPSAKSPPKDDGMKATMETTGPPPAPTASYFYGPSAYFPVPGVAGVAVPPPVGSYDPRFAPLSIFHPMSKLPVAPPSPSSSSCTDKKSPKALDLLHQVAFKTGHKMHELGVPDSSPIGTSSNLQSCGPSVMSSSSKSPSSLSSSSQKPLESSPKEHSSSSNSASPPPQKHLHTHHHTHVGLGYPIYDPYALIASQQAAATIHHFAPK